MTLYGQLWLKGASARRRAVTYWWSSYYAIYLRCHPAVKRVGRLRITGRVTWRLHPSSTVELGDELRINSGAEVNAVGGHRRCVIAVLAGGRLRIGARTGISSSTIVCQQQIEIGSDVLIGGDCSVYDSDFHPLEYQTRLHLPAQPGVTKPVSIADGCFLGAHAIVLKGTSLGRASVIGAGSVVSGVIPAKEIWAGSPARRIRALGSSAEHNRTQTV